MKRRSNGGTVGTGTDGIDRGTAELAGALERAGLSFKLWESLVEVLT